MALTKRTEKMQNGVNDETIQSNIKLIEDETIEKACALLASYNNKIHDYIACFVSSLCDVEFKDLMYDTKHLNVVKARWLYWYAYRYLTNDSFDTIAKMTSQYRKFATSCVGSSCAKMSRMIDIEPIWNKRWQILKRIIKIANKTSLNESQTIRITYPRNIKIELKQE